MKKGIVIITMMILVISQSCGCSDKEDTGNANRCYLCGDSDESMMSYYRKFDAIGVIGLNEWCVLDFGLGVESYGSGTRTIFGNNQGVTYRIERRRAEESRI